MRSLHRILEPKILASQQYDRTKRNSAQYMQPFNSNEKLSQYHKCFSQAHATPAMDIHETTSKTVLPSLVKKFAKEMFNNGEFPLSDTNNGTTIIQSPKSTSHFKGVKHAEWNYRLHVFV